MATKTAGSQGEAYNARFEVDASGQEIVDEERRLAFEAHQRDLLVKQVANLEARVERAKQHLADAEASLADAKARLDKEP